MHPTRRSRGRRPSKERPQARGTLLYQEGIPESEETEKEGSQAQVAQEARASLPIKRHQHVWEARGNACTADVIVMKPVCPSSSWSCKQGFERVCSLPRFGFQYRTGYRYPLVYCVSAGNDIIQVSFVQEYRCNNNRCPSFQYRTGYRYPVLYCSGPRVFPIHIPRPMKQNRISISCFASQPEILCLSQLTLRDSTLYLNRASYRVSYES